MVTYQGSHWLEKYLNIEAFLEKSFLEMYVARMGLMTPLANHKCQIISPTYTAILLPILTFYHMTSRLGVK